MCGRWRRGWRIEVVVRFLSGGRARADNDIFAVGFASDERGGPVFRARWFVGNGTRLSRRRFATADMAGDYGRRVARVIRLGKLHAAHQRSIQQSEVFRWMQVFG